MGLKRKTRMYEPWGYREENNYQSSEIIMDNDLYTFFADTKYVKDDNKIYFYNKDGDQVGELDVSEFVKSDSIIEKTEYSDGILTITFTNGDVITIDLTELLDENEFKDGLTVSDHVVKVLVDSESEPYLSVSEAGVKVSGIDAAIKVETDRATAAEEALDAKINAEIERATSAETALDEKIENEITRATAAEEALDAKIDAEETRAKGREDEIEVALNAEKTRATQTEQALDSRINSLNDELDAEESRAQAAEQEIRTLLTNEIAERKADVDEEEARAKAAEQALQDAIDAETSRATSAETALDAKIDAEIAERKAEAVASVDYDESGKTIDFYNANNDKIDSIDATVFIKDGMIDSVELVELSGNTYLRITWNTDAGKEVTELDLGDLFDADNYYTKAEADEAIEEVVEAEEVRAISAETSLDSKIEALRQSLEAETDRAVSAETALQNAIEYEIAERKAESVASVDYDESGKTIDFYNANNEKIDSIDATPFITAGMIDSVYVDHDTEELVIVWITETGTEETRISLSEIFNPDDYYTKNEIDEIISGITESEEDLESKIAALRGLLEEEIERAQEAEEALDDADIASGNIASDATISITKNNGEIIIFSSAEQIDLEAGDF